MAGDRLAGPWARGLVVAAALAAAGCDAPTVPEGTPSYDPRFRSATGALLLYHWPLGKTIDIYVDPRGAPRGLDLAAAVRPAGAMWRSHVFYREFDVRLVGDPAAADVLFRFDTAPSLVLFECPSTLALAGPAGVTAACPDESRGVFLPFLFLDGTSSRAKFEVAINGDPQRMSTMGFLQAIVGHEMGHVLGIGSHSPNPLDLMASSPQVGSPGSGDAHTLRYLLHRPADLKP